MTTTITSMFFMLSGFSLNNLLPFLLFHGYLWLPVLLTFCATGTSYEYLFRPTPANPFYDGMLIAVCVSIPIVLLQEPAQCFEKGVTAMTVFMILLAWALGILNWISWFPLSGFFWTLLALIVTVLSIRRIQQGQWQLPKWHFQSRRSPVVWICSIFLVVVSIGFIAFPVSQSWEGPPEPFVRWHPFSVRGELVWRGIFFSYAIAMALGSIEDPIGKHRPFMIYLFVSGCLHATVMLIMALSEMSTGGRNGNPQHLYGDVAGWYMVGCVAGMIVLLTRNTSTGYISPSQ